MFLVIFLILEYIIKHEDEGKQLKDILKNKLYLSSILRKKLKECKGILVNGSSTFLNSPVKINDKITIYLDKIKNETKFMDKFPLVDGKLDILYEDEFLLIVNKPANMPVHPSSENYTNTLSNLVANYLFKQNIFQIHIITRLDKDTTGICIFAKHAYIQELFIRKKEQIKLTKTYIAIVNGILTKEHDIIEKNIARKDGTIILREVNEKGDYAKTEYYVIQKNLLKNYSALKIILHTGRTHQIRVHMSYLGYPLLGDDLYAPDIPNINQYITRQALHAYKISFIHPMTNQSIALWANLPDDMNSLINSEKTERKS